MGWVVLTLGMVALGVAYLISTLRRIDRVRDEQGHYRLSVRFWGMLGVLGFLLIAMFVQPLRGIAFLNTESGLVSVMLVAIPPLAVIFAGLRNATLLYSAHRRRRRALEVGTVVPAQVVQRTRRALSHDIMAVVVDADIPSGEPSAHMSYRAREPYRSERHRFVETCPGDHWHRLEPGRTVQLCYDPVNPDNYAVLLFEATDPAPAE